MQLPENNTKGLSLDMLKFIDFLVSGSCIIQGCMERGLKWTKPQINPLGTGSDSIYQFILVSDLMSDYSMCDFLSYGL
jgi:hypothetical protein